MGARGCSETNKSEGGAKSRAEQRAGLKKLRMGIVGSRNERLRLHGSAESIIPYEDDEYPDGRLSEADQDLLQYPSGLNAGAQPRVAVCRVGCSGLAFKFKRRLH